jgi:hypothetical protein
MLGLFCSEYVLVVIDLVKGSLYHFLHAKIIVCGC